MAAIVILLLYQGYTLSIVGIASPWIAKTFALDESKLASCLRGWRFPHSAHYYSRDWRIVLDAGW